MHYAFMATLDERFRIRFIGDDPEKCWPWQGLRDADGYGVLWAGGNNRRATHIALIFDGRPRPDGAQVLHSCDNPPCVNPAHLSWGTAGDNARDRAAKGRGNTSAGENHWTKLLPETVPKGSARGGAKLTEIDVAEMRASSDNHKTTSLKFGVSATLVSMVRARKVWKHVP